MHNVEWQYYESLSRLTPVTEPLKKAYFLLKVSNCSVPNPGWCFMPTS